MKGKAREATVDMTAQSTARQASCSPVNRCMRSVRTWAQRSVSAGAPSWALCPPPPQAQLGPGVPTPPDTAPQPHWGLTASESPLCPPLPP